MIIKCVLFDLDGTLIDSEPWQYESYRMAFLDFGFNLTKEDFFKYMVVKGYSTTELIDEFNLSISSTDLFIAKTIHYKELVKSEVKLRDGVSHLINYLSNHSIKLGLVTSSRRETADIVLNKFKLKNKFGVVITRDDVINRKPNKEPYEKAIMKLNVKNTEAIVLEDNPCGVKSAKANDIFCIAIPNGFTKDADFSDADLKLDNFFQVKDFIICNI